MKKYKVTGKSKCRVFDGFVPGVQANGQPINMVVEVVFDENGIGEADESVNLSSWLMEGFIVELKPTVVVPVVPKKVVDVAVPVKEESVPAVVQNEQVDDGSDDADYEELDDGTFRCLRCKEEKIFKTEGRVISHVEKVHGKK